MQRSGPGPNHSVRAPGALTHCLHVRGPGALTDTTDLRCAPQSSVFCWPCRFFASCLRSEVQCCFCDLAILPQSVANKEIKVRSYQQTDLPKCLSSCGQI